MNNNGMINSLMGKVKKIKIQLNVKSMICLTLSMQVFSASIVFAKVGDENTQLLIKFKEQSSTPQIMHIQGTQKIIINFDNASELKYPIDAKSNKLIKDVVTQKNGNKVRIAIDTFKPVSYSINKNTGDTFVVNLEESQIFQEKDTNIVDKKVVTYSILESKNIVPIPMKVVTQTINNIQEAELEHINIKANGKNAKVTLDLNDNSVVPNIIQTGNLLIIDLPNVKVPEEFQKNTIMSNLGTIVQNIDIAMQKGSGRIVLSQNDTWSYSTYQMDKKFVIEVKPMRDNEKEIYKGKPLTLNFQNMDVRAILQAIADFTNLNIMSSDSITGAMTIRLKDVPWDQALDLILEAKNLQKQKQGNVIWVATRQEITDKNKSQLELNNQANELAPLKLEFVQLNHYKAKEMKEVLEGKTGGGESSGEKGGSNFALLSKRGSVGLDVRNNKLFIQDTEMKLEEITKIIKKLDVASKQVLIEAKLVVVDDKFGRDFGAKFGFGLGKKNNSTGIGLSNSSGDATTIANGGTPTGSVFNMPTTGGSIGFTILNAVTGNMLNLELSALEENNRGKVISNPRLLTADNKKAEIRQGTEIPYVTPGSANSPATVSFKDAVLSLGVTPQVSPNGRVSMDLEITKDTIGQLVSVQGGGQVPSIDTRKITTQVTVNDGQTVVLGGIYEVTSRDDLSKVPFLGDIPWVGNLFKRSSKSNEKVELLIFITPHVIEDEDLDAINKNEQQKVDELNFIKKTASNKQVQ